MADKLPISLILLTHNEERNIEFCLKSVSNWIGEIVVIDSFSTDRTLEICRQYNCRIYQHPFEYHAKQVNWALDNIDFTFDWVLRLDADEFISAELAEELGALFCPFNSDSIAQLTARQGVTGIYLKRRFYFMKRWIKHGGYYPTWLLRLFRKDAGRYEDLLVGEHVILHFGKTIKLRNDFIDYNRKSLSYWSNKHARRTLKEMGASPKLTGRAVLPQKGIPPMFFSTQEKRKRWIKIYAYARMPLFFRAYLYFFYRYFIRLGFLDGVEGLIFHVLQGFWYRFYVDAKIFEAHKVGLEKAGEMVDYAPSKPWIWGYKE